MARGEDSTGRVRISPELCEAGSEVRKPAAGRDGRPGVRENSETVLECTCAQ